MWLDAKTFPPAAQSGSRSCSTIFDSRQDLLIGATANAIAERFVRTTRSECLH
jgi:hypothetical protein